jgi:N-acetylglucosamine-6-phosphate deacetylase
MKLAVQNAIILTPSKRIEGCQVRIEDGRIARLEPAGAVEAGTQAIDARGHYLIPGLIDIHTHGADGRDTMDATPEALGHMARFFARHGVTSYLPTTVTATATATQAAIQNVSQTPAPSDGSQHLGIHLEGPYLSREYRGAQPVQHLRSADPREYRDWLDTGTVMLMTVAPEVDGVTALLEAGTARGIAFAVGHSGASYDQVLQAIDHGLRQVTHTFNGMPPLHHRAPGVLGAALGEERLWCQVIADGIHVHPAIVSLLIRTKGPEKTILVTDSTRATGMPDGEYALGDSQIHVQDGVARTKTGGLAGSTLTLDQALQNAILFCGLSLQDALPMATQTPAAAMGWGDHKGIIGAGADADLVVLDGAYQVRMTMVAGRIVYDRLLPERQETG